MLQKRKGFTLIELLVVIAIIAILASILFPVFARAREKARQASCGSNCKQLALAALMYAQDYDESFPGFYSKLSSGNWPLKQWCHDLMPYIKNTQIFRCPSGGDSNTSANTPPLAPRFPLCYGTNPRVFSGGRGNFNNNDAQFTSTAETLMLFDGIRSGRYCTYPMGIVGRFDGCRGRPAGIATVSNAGLTAGMDYARHNSGSNIAFVDGHVKWLKSGTWEQVTGVSWANRRQNLIYMKYWARRR